MTYFSLEMTRYKLTLPVLEMVIQSYFLIHILRLHPPFPSSSCCFLYPLSLKFSIVSNFIHSNVHSHSSTKFRIPRLSSPSASFSSCFLLFNSPSETFCRLGETLKHLRKDTWTFLSLLLSLPHYLIIFLIFLTIFLHHLLLLLSSEGRKS